MEAMVHITALLLAEMGRWQWGQMCSGAEKCVTRTDFFSYLFALLFSP